MRDVAIISYCRTAIARAQRGALNQTHGVPLAAHVLRGAVERATIEAGEVEDVVLGCGLPEGATGHNVARNAALEAGFGVEVPGMTVNRYCGSGLSAASIVANRIACGEAQIAIAGGVESISLVQFHLNLNNFFYAPLQQRMPAVWWTMNQTADFVAKKYGITREAQDAVALGSQMKAAAAQEGGRFKDEIVPVSIAQKKGDAILFAADEFINKKTSAEALAGLRPAFDKAGSVTAGNASGLNDGAAGVVLMTAAKAAALGLPVLGRIASYASAGLDPKIMGMGPVPAARKALERAGWKAADLDLLEINEAFAAQACAVHQEMGWDTSKVNVNGGAIAIGHPIGASGCRILVTLLHEMAKRDAKKGIASLCIGGGMGVALTIER